MGTVVLTGKISFLLFVCCVHVDGKLNFFSFLYAVFIVQCIHFTYMQTRSVTKLQWAR